MNGWNTSFFFWDGLFAGVMLVSRSVFHSLICPNEWQTRQKQEKMQIICRVWYVCFSLFAPICKKMYASKIGNHLAQVINGVHNSNDLFWSKYQFLHSRVDGCDALIWMSSIKKHIYFGGISPWNELVIIVEVAQLPGAKRAPEMSSFLPTDPRPSTFPQMDVFFHRFGSVGYKPNIS